MVTAVNRRRFDFRAEAEAEAETISKNLFDREAALGRMKQSEPVLRKWVKNNLIGGDFSNLKIIY